MSNLKNEEEVNLGILEFLSDEELSINLSNKNIQKMKEHVRIINKTSSPYRFAIHENGSGASRINNRIKSFTSIEYQAPKKDHKYILAYNWADNILNSTIHIVDIETKKQVTEFIEVVDDAYDFAELTNALSYKYNDAKIVTIDTFQNNVISQNLNKLNNNTYEVFSTSKQNRIEIYNLLNSYLKKNYLPISSADVFYDILKNTCNNTPKISIPSFLLGVAFFFSEKKENKNTNKSELISLRIDEYLLEQAKLLSNKSGESVSGYIRNLLEKDLKNQRKKF